MFKKRISIMLIVLFILINISNVLADNEDPNSDVFVSNIEKWTFVGEGEFGEKINYYGEDGKFMSHQTTQYVYAIANKDISGDKSFTFEVEFDIPNYDTTGADNGWCWQSILFGIQNPEEPGDDNLATITFAHFPEGQETIKFASVFSGYADNIEMLESKVSDLSHKVLIYYSIIDESLTITIDGEETFEMTDASDDVKGKLGFGATWSCMRILKAVYTELDETPQPSTPTPEKTVEPTQAPIPKKTEETDITKGSKKDINGPMIVMIILGFFIIASVVTILILIKKKRHN